MDNLLELHALSKKFGSFSAVDNLSFAVRPGEIFGFLGPNGAGKTTTIKMIAGLLLPTAGEICICGKQLHEDPTAAKARTGYIPDRPFIYEKLTGREYLNFIASLYKENWQKLGDPLESADYYLKLFDLLAWKDHLIESYSHGMRQKLIMTSIFMLQTPLIVVDEPMVGLDPKSARIVKEMFKAKVTVDRDSAILLSTHSMEIAEELCDRIAIIDHGRVVATGSVEELRSLAREDGAGLEEIFFQLTGAWELQSIIDALRSSSEEHC